ncbi:hypothetical protein C900_00855 [Fulvivirga imtechensis AK7]|uniref:DoxX family protein n=1 Tax=Fulvivirga imtechensis AK7 TaxID=1237149 RepID=L8JZ22_9BACT|nr:hypothetical protein [Fulvivirga imtechensis]ELR72894.1 hypothetical protein C900_00855 [Fulvivirga imtechensis AK7]
MKPLIVLIVTFLIALVAFKIFRNAYELALSARIALSITLLFTAMGHFAFSEGMAMMVPEFIPFKKEMVYLTGLIEIAAAIGLHVPQLRPLTGWLLILFFVLVLPANIKAAMEQVDYQKATFGGPGVTYLWFRVPLQILFIVWTYFSAVRN